MKTTLLPRNWAALALMMIVSAMFVGCATTEEAERNPASATCSTEVTADQVCDEGYIKYDRKVRSKF